MENAMAELPLAIFTTLVPFGAGAFIMLAISFFTTKFGADELKNMLAKLTDAVTYGIVLRAKGIVEGRDGKWLHFDYNPGEPDVHEGCPAYTGRLCVIGSKLDKEELAELFGVE